MKALFVGDHLKKSFKTTRRAFFFGVYLKSLANTTRRPEDLFDWFSVYSFRLILENCRYFIFIFFSNSTTLQLVSRVLPSIKIFIFSIKVNNAKPSNSDLSDEFKFV